MHTPSVSNLARQPLPSLLPPLVIWQSELRRHVVTAASIPLAEMPSFLGSSTLASLSTAAIHCKDIRARGSSGISRGSDTGMVTRDPLTPDRL